LGILNFLKQKKSQDSKDDFSSLGDFDTPPPMPESGQDQPQGSHGNRELYAELPNLPEAPDIPGLPEIELPPLPKENSSAFSENKEVGTAEHVEPLLPNWPKMRQEEVNLPVDVPDMFAGIDKGASVDIPEAKPYAPENKETSGLVCHNNSFFLKAEDFWVIKNSLNALTSAQKKHHKLTEIKKEENLQYEKMNVIVEDMQRKLMHVDRTLFE